ncbi:hypothetical protein SERLA73DRAFT_180482 [Serpula lacrymans var. lacrymans S7.3]|uniref:Uncharacterized protein n=1 Tax=Serpula lacrymans var. lacrymans (strain S7.3) TaxID=936435 RepID=F8PUZ4_SERL3|nr:hypothetical protein SERLA73DRAFT_180482 [Serpula lacrymans var. lacrymans S7.3]
MDPSNADDNMENQNSAPSKASKETRLSTPITHSPEIPYPTPAQRTKSRSRLPPSVHPRTSSPPLPSVPDSPFPPSPSLHLPARKTVLRRVPHPGIPPPPDPNVSGPGRVLVPNSDTSGTASQPSQPPPQPYESSQYLPLPPSSLPVSFGVNSQSTGNAPRKYLTKMMESSLLRVCLTTKGRL